MRNCGQCGAQVSDLAKFCDQCGSKLGTPSSTEFSPTTPTPDVNIDITNKAVPEPSAAPAHEPESAAAEPGDEIEELDLTALDKKISSASSAGDHQEPKTTTKNKDNPTTSESKHTVEPRQNNNIIDLKEVLESEEKVEADDSIKREVLADDEVFSKVCPMCGEELQLNKQLMENTPVMVKCLKCGNETKIW